ASVKPAKPAVPCNKAERAWWRAWPGVGRSWAAAARAKKGARPNEPARPPGAKEGLGSGDGLARLGLGSGDGLAANAEVGEGDDEGCGGGDEPWPLASRSRSSLLISAAS